MISPVALAAGERRLRALLDQQVVDIDTDSEIAPGYWAVLAHATADEESKVLVEALLETAPFPHHCGPSSDDAWQIHYVATADKPTACHWLADTKNVLHGRVRDPSPAQKAVLLELVESTMPHRIARQITTDFSAGAFPLGGIRTPPLVRSLLDRIHAREPLFLAALHQLMDHHLIDLLVLKQQVIEEDIEICNELTKGAVSHDPFFKSRQESVAAIRELLIAAKIINPLDQRLHSAVRNPYAALVPLRLRAESVFLRVDGLEQELPRDTFIAAIRVLRSRCYLGDTLEDMDTRAPWLAATDAYPLRYVRQQLAAQPATSALHWLYLLERAMES